MLVSATPDHGSRQGSKRLGREFYSVGWICALHTEYSAACMLLDEEYETPDDLPAGDNNTYTVGLMSSHELVVAVCPDGEYGTTSAATVARDLVRSFPQIKIGLMVGIGGGAPSPKHDIRLGDVVISSAKGSSGGVFQYDMGKAIQGEEFLHTGSLDRPPVSLRTAVADLRSRIDRDGHDIQQIIDRALEGKSRRVQRKFSKPDVSDVLFVSSYVHKASPDKSCIDACDDSTLNTIRRDTRETEDGDIDPDIHFGIVASGNMLMKDALLRDEISSNHDVLCFEMEAAGLMNHFPCIVIRGICDYSDTHKNDLWHGYAAMTAAALAKLLLCRTLQNRVRTEPVISTQLATIIDAQSNTLQLVQDQSDKMRNLAEKSRMQEMKDWLKPSETAGDLRRHAELCHPGTDKGLLTSPKFEDWKSGRNKHLWLRGMPGCGKSVMIANVISRIREDPACNSPLIYFLFNFRDGTGQQTFDHMLRTLIWQLISQNVLAASVMYGLYVDRLKRTEGPTIQDLLSVLHAIAEADEEIIIVLDALDECLTTKPLLDFVQLLRQRNIPNLRLLASARPHDNVIKGLGDMICISFEEFRVDADITTFVEHWISSDETMADRWSNHPGVLREVVVSLTSKAAGMFRWVVCQLDAIRRCCTVHDLEMTLKNLPDTLDETYARVLQQIPPQSLDRVVLLLQLLMNSPKQVKLEDAVSILALDQEGRMDLKRRLTRYRDIFDWCPCVFSTTLFEDGVRIQFAHSSVQEYLISGRVIDPINHQLRLETANQRLGLLSVHFMRQFIALEKEQLDKAAAIAARMRSPLQQPPDLKKARSRRERRARPQRTSQSSSQHELLPTQGYPYRTRPAQDNAGSLTGDRHGSYYDHRRSRRRQDYTERENSIRNLVLNFDSKQAPHQMKVQCLTNTSSMNAHGSLSQLNELRRMYTDSYARAASQGRIGEQSRDDPYINTDSDQRYALSNDLLELVSSIWTAFVRAVQSTDHSIDREVAFFLIDNIELLSRRHGVFAPTRQWDAPLEFEDGSHAAQYFCRERGLEGCHRLLQRIAEDAQARNDAEIPAFWTHGRNSSTPR